MGFIENNRTELAAPLGASFARAKSMSEMIAKLLPAICECGRKLRSQLERDGEKCDECQPRQTDKPNGEELNES